MNRARTEAMLSGSCVVQVEGAHDIEKIADNWKNMILVNNDAKIISKCVVSLLENGYDKAIKVGEEGKKTALELFNRERYRQDWLDLINNKILCK